MTPPLLIQSKTSLPLADIVLGERLRPVGDAGVAAMLASIRDLGQITSPINIRQIRREGGLRYVMIDGAHRLAAAQALGWEEVPVRVFECNDDQARIMEIDGNLAGAELNALDTAVFLATRKAVYERLHPETMAQAGAGLAARRWNAADTMSVASFVTTTADKFGLSERHVRRMTAAGLRLGPDEIRQLRLAPKAVTLADLQAISGIGEAPERYEVVRMLAVGEAKSAAAARKAYLHKGHPPVILDPVDAEMIALRKIWDRAHKASKIRFVEVMRKELTALLAQADDEDDL